MKKNLNLLGSAASFINTIVITIISLEGATVVELIIIIVIEMD